MDAIISAFPGVGVWAKSKSSVIIVSGIFQLHQVKFKIAKLY